MNNNKVGPKPPSRLSEFFDTSLRPPSSTIHSRKNSQSKQLNMKIANSILQAQSSNPSEYNLNSQEPKLLRIPRNQKSNEEIIRQTLHLFRRIKKNDKPPLPIGVNNIDQTERSNSINSEHNDSLSNEPDIAEYHSIWDDSDLFLNGYFNLDELNIFQLYKLRMMTYPTMKLSSSTNSIILKSFLEVQKSSSEMNLQRIKKKQKFGDIILKQKLNQVQYFSISDSIKQYQNDQVMVSQDISSTETYKQFKDHFQSYVEQEFKSQRSQKYKRYVQKLVQEQVASKKGTDLIKKQFLEMLNDPLEEIQSSNQLNFDKPISPKITSTLLNDDERISLGICTPIGSHTQIASNNYISSTPTSGGTLTSPADFAKSFQIKRVSSKSQIQQFQNGSFSPQFQQRILQESPLVNQNQILLNENNQRRISSSSNSSLGESKQILQFFQSKKMEQTPIEEQFSECKYQQEETRKLSSPTKRANSHHSQIQDQLSIKQRLISLNDLGAADPKLFDPTSKARQKTSQFGADWAVRQSLENAIQQKLIINSVHPSSTQCDSGKNNSPLKVNNLSNMSFKNTPSSQTYLPKISHFNPSNCETPKMKNPLGQNFARLNSPSTFSSNENVRNLSHQSSSFSNLNGLLGYNSPSSKGMITSKQNSISNFKEAISNNLITANNKSIRGNSFVNEKNIFPHPPSRRQIRTTEKSSFLSLDKRQIESTSQA